MRTLYSLLSSILDCRVTFVNSLILLLCFVGCAPIVRLPDAIQQDEFKDPPTDKRQFIVLKDGSIVYGKKVTGWARGALGDKTVAHIDGRKIPVSDVLALQNENGYWIKREDNTTVKRLVKGKITVYRSEYDYPRPILFFFQKENGPLQQLNARQQVKELLRDCPKAYDRLNISDAEYRKTVRKQPEFLQTVVEAYNSCDGVK